jgi:hypothetical protein
MTTLLSRPPAPTRARLAGALYFVIIVTGIFSELVRASVLVPGDPAATAANLVDAEWLYRAAFVAGLALIVCEAILTVLLYDLFRPVSRAGSLLAATLRLASLPVYGAALLFMFAALTATDTERTAPLAPFLLETHAYGYAIGLTFFAVNCFVTGRLLVRATRLPSALGVLLAVAGAGYLVNSLLYFLVPGYHGSAAAALLVPALVAEVWLAVVLLRTRDGAVTDA